MSKRKRHDTESKKPWLDDVRLREEKKGQPASALAQFKWQIVALLAVVGLATWMLWPSRDYTPVSTTLAPKPKPFVMPEERAVFATYAGAASCKECHAAMFEKWAPSNHGMAERLLRDDLDRSAFDPPRTISHGTQTTEARISGGVHQIVSLGFGNRREPYKIERVIGHDPLRQFLVAGSGGRFHAMEACWDPREAEWFNVYGDEDRKPGEWGHWTGRGMVWNQMCASCHNTRLRKNYDAASDGYRTTMAEMTVSCESCHGPRKEHVDWQRAWSASTRAQRPADPTITRFSRDQMIENCAGCHARRGELTGDFVPGDSFWDHYMLTIVDHTDTYYPDGQVRDENYEFASFLSSRMYHAGVRCVDCHDQHSLKPVLPGNQLCMRCHTAGGYPNAPTIAPEAHSFHGPESAGNQCVNCHMPQTTYMQRHPRHDHGFTIPDPLLTKQFNVPNACNRCHTDKDADWALQACEKWWGKKMERRTRQRAQVIAKARQGRDEVRDGLLGLLGGDEIPYWKASATLLLERWVQQQPVSGAVIAQTKHEHPLVRSAAARSLEPLVSAGHSGARAAVQSLLDDPRRVVRVAAAWTLRDSVDEQSVAGMDLKHMLEWNADQPSGQMQLGQYHFARRNLAGATNSMETAIRWDPNSPPFHHDLAMVHAAGGDNARAIAKLQDAIKLAPNEAQYHYELGLAWSESGDLDQTISSLREAVRLDPRLARAWYNLGLALNSQGKISEALDALHKGEFAEPGDPGIPYARATILAQQGRKDEARLAAERALQIRPDYTEARQLLMMLDR